MTDNCGRAITDDNLVFCEIRRLNEKTYRDFSKFYSAKAIDSMTKVNRELAEDDNNVNDIEN